MQEDNSNTLQTNWKAMLIQFVIATIAVSTTSFFMSAYFWSMAIEFMPKPGTTFERESISGTYHWRNLPGGRNFGSYIDERRIFCGSFSYYSGTFFQPGGYFDCGLKNTLEGKSVVAELVSLPLKNKGAGPVVVKLVGSNGDIYIDISDSEIIDLWIKETRWSGNFEQGSMLIFGLVIFFTLLKTRNLANKLAQGWSNAI